MNQFAMSLPEAQCYEVFDGCEEGYYGFESTRGLRLFLCLGLVATKLTFL